MRGADLDRLSGVLGEPLERFARDSRVRLVLLMNPSGQVLAQRGFSRGLNIAAFASLAAAVHVSTRAMAEMLGQPRFGHLHQGGGERQIFIGSCPVPAAEEVVLIAVFGSDSTIGLVRVFFDTLARELAALPEWGLAHRAGDAASFDDDLMAGVRRLNGAA